MTKAKNVLNLLVLAMVLVSCGEKSTVEKHGVKLSEEFVKLPEPSNQIPSGRLGVGRFYNVSNQWTPGAWMRQGDFNGDGKQDIIALNNYNTEAYVKLSQGEEQTTYISETWFTDGVYGGSPWTFTGDFNGDGYTDIASAIGGSVYMKINNKNGGFNFAVWNVSNQWGGDGYNIVGDFNGDGKDDLAGFVGTTAYMKISTGQAFQSLIWYTDGFFGGQGFTYGIDYDGDGKDDAVSASGSNIYVKKSNGNGFSNFTHSTSNTWGSVFYTWGGDTNNNGKGEIITAIGGTIIVREWIGTNTWGLVSNSTQNLWGGPGYNWAMNQNGNVGDGDEIVSAIGSQIFVH